MKPLPEEVEIEKIFNIIKEVNPLMKTPPLYMVDLEDGFSSFGRCSDKGVVKFSLSCGGERVITNEGFVNTVCHEIIHYNHFEWRHNEQFECALNLLFPVVLNKIKQKIEEEKNYGTNNREKATE